MWHFSIMGPIWSNIIKYQKFTVSKRQRTFSIHTVKYQFGMPLALLICFWKNIFWSTLICKNRKRKKNDIPHCPFELPAKQHSRFGPSGLDWLWELAGNSKEHWGKYIFFSFPAFAYKSRPKYIFYRDINCNRHFELIFHSVNMADHMVFMLSSVQSKPLNVFHHFSNLKKFVLSSCELD